MRIAALVAALGIAATAGAEPYLAVREGLDCAACHVNPSGGGQRNSFGNHYAQTVLPAHQPQMEAWTGELARYLAIGGNARFSARHQEDTSGDDFVSFRTDRVSLYLSANFLDYFTLYLDEQIAPDGALNREAWGMFRFASRYYLKAGKMFLPYGWRLEDDSAFVRSVTGVNFATPDAGLELGYLGNTVNAQLALTNGTAAAEEVDKGKQVTAKVGLVRSAWQLGFSGSLNSTDVGDRSLVGIYAGLNTGPVSWLAQWDRIEDDADTLQQKQQVALVEGNWLMQRGHNLKFTLEGRWLGQGEGDEWRYSLAWEYFPLPFIQIRLGYRYAREEDIADPLGLDEYFVQLHGFF